MPGFSMEEILRATGAAVSGDGDALFSDVTTDTRTIEKGALFIALKGERFNGEDFLQKAQEAGVVKTSSGLLYKIIADPTPNDAQPNYNSYVTCDYSVKLINGYQVDGGTHISFSLTNTIPGFSEGCHKIHNNGDIELYIPAYLSYDYTKYQSDEYDEAEGTGTEGTSSYIPPYSTLIYTIHLCGVSGN